MAPLEASEPHAARGRVSLGVLGASSYTALLSVRPALILSYLHFKNPPSFFLQPIFELHLLHEFASEWRERKYPQTIPKSAEEVCKYAKSKKTEENSTGA